LIGVRQRSGARPILSRRKRVEHARDDRCGGRFGQQSVIGERRKVDWAKNGEYRVARLTRAGEAVIEAAAAGSGGCDHQPIERRTSALVLVEAVAHELAQKSPTLRITESDHATHQRRVLSQGRHGASMFEVRREVAYGGE